MNSPEVKSLINDYRSLFWYTPENEKENIGHDLLVETILNYGDEKAIKRLFDSLGVDYVASVFKNHIQMSERRKGNYHELTRNFFDLYFKRHAPSYSL